MESDATPRKNTEHLSTQVTPGTVDAIVTLADTTAPFTAGGTATWVATAWNRGSAPTTGLVTLDLSSSAPPPAAAPAWTSPPNQSPTPAPPPAGGTPPPAPMPGPTPATPPA